MMRDSETKGKKTRRPKMKHGLPDPDQAKSAVLNSLRSPKSQRGYRHSIDEFHRLVLFRAARLFQQNRRHTLSNAVSWRQGRSTHALPSCAVATPLSSSARSATPWGFGRGQPTYCSLLRSHRLLPESSLLTVILVMVEHGLVWLTSRNGWGISRLRSH